MTESALIIGAGNGLSASLARLFASEGMTVGLAARNTAKLSGLVDEIGGRAYGCDASDPDHMEKLFQEFEAHSGSPDIMVYNPSARVRGPISDIDAAATKDAILVTAYGAFLAAQQSAFPRAWKVISTSVCAGWSRKPYLQSTSMPSPPRKSSMEPNAPG